MRLLTSVDFILAPLVVHTVVLASSSTSSSLDNGIYDWVRQRGGLYHDAQEFRREITEDGKSIAGVFATRDIPKGTSLAKIPWNLVIPSDDLDESGQLCCGLVTRLKRELQLGTKSQFAPYIDYVSKLPVASIPTMWSEMGKKLVLELTGSHSPKDELPPSDPLQWMEHDWFPNCGGSWKDTLGIQAAIIVITRSDDHILIPGYDMYNHRNGNWTNADTFAEEDVVHVTVATRDIRKGEQIYISYNQCDGCENRFIGYGTGEIFRDYGFVEPLPQRFYYTDDDRYMVQFDVVSTDENGGSLKVVWNPKFGIPKEKYASRALVAFLRRQIRRLRRLRNISYRNGNPGMPEYEWETAWEYQRVNIRAMTMALEAMGESVDIPSKSIVTTTASMTAPHYDPLGPEPDYLTYSDETCENEDELQHVHHFEVDSRETQYQDLSFMIEPYTRDVVMELDTVTQIASVYRPQYHEYSVHAAARFLESVKRVIFIGGGDSMLLHEVLKYPELELVVGLELDQVVTRKAFRYFSTQPHFDDPRVEWWFGDATKSLLLLPKDYWQSFDLVLVDLSETVMSFRVTSQLDMFDALALLLKPEGVLVKNEIYMETISNAFDHTIQICYISPVICDQVLTMGSNKVDFFHSPVKDHGVETLLYEPMVASENRHDFLHDYRRNDARAQGKCELLPSIHDERTKSAGIMEVVEAEKVSIQLDETAVSVLEEAITMAGFHFSRKTAYDTNLVLFSMKEGYVMARFFPEEKYCNLDINLWGRFDKLKSLSAAITKALGSKLVSNYRVVVGGMFGSTTWEADKELIGPQIVQTRDCSTPQVNSTKSSADETSVIKTALDKSLSSLLQGESSVALTICGPKDVACLANDVLQKSTVVEEAVRLSTCTQLDPADSSSLYDCELAIRAEWAELLFRSKKLGVLAFDATAPKEMLQIVNSILNDDEFRTLAFSERHVVLTWSIQPDKEPWRQEFLDRYRKQHVDDPVSHSVYEITWGPSALDLGLVCAGQEDIAFRLDQAEKSIQKHLADGSVSLKMIHGGKYAYWEPWEPWRFLQSDYDNNPGLTQYYEQKPLAIHTLVQFERVKGSRYNPSQKGIKDAFEHALTVVGVTCTTKVEVDKVGEGCVFACLNPQFGSIVLVWDGRLHIDSSYYTTERGNHAGADMERFFVSFREKMDLKMGVALRDEMPRGIGRIVNFKSDMRTPEQREYMFEQLLKRAEKRTGKKKVDAKQYYTRNLGAVPKVEEGSCSNDGADGSTCRPDLPPMEG